MCELLPGFQSTGRRGDSLCYLVKVLLRGSHLLPGLVEELDADAEKLLHQMVLPEEDGVVVRSRLGGWLEGSGGGGW